MPIKSKKQKFHILVDMDETTGDLFTPWIKWMNENGDPDITLDKITSWNLHQHTVMGHKCYDFLAIPGVFLDLEPLPEAIGIINKLRKQGHRIQFCTSDPKNSPTEIGNTMSNAQLEKIEWLKDKFKWFDEKTDIIFSHDKGSETGDILFDDRAKWCFEFPGIAVCKDMPYNQNYKGFRVSSWIEFDNLIQRLSAYAPEVKK